MEPAPFLNSYLAFSGFCYVPSLFCVGLLFASKNPSHMSAKCVSMTHLSEHFGAIGSEMVAGNGRILKKNMQKQSECSGWETGTGAPNKLRCSKHVCDVSAALKGMQCRMLFSWLFCMKIWKNNFDFQWKGSMKCHFFFRDVRNEMA